MYTNRIAVENSSKFVDLRSDTVTKPCEKMRKAMAEAEVGDDVYSEDPTINALEERCARLFNKEAALFVVSGTMGNLLSIMSHTQGEGQIIVGLTNHIHRWERGNYARLGRVSATTLKVQEDGTLNLDEIREVTCLGDLHRPQTRVICLENTHNYAGGKVLSKEYMKKVRKLADEFGMKIHLDGARIYNAAMKLNMSLAEITAEADSVQMCFSKGLGAPVGSIIVGTKEFIDIARHDRKALGGGWRQGGILAAAAMYALDIANETIPNDHRRAEYLAKRINEINEKSSRNFFRAETKNITNMVLLTCENGMTPEIVQMAMKEFGVLVMHFDEKRVRMVVHRGIDDESIEKVIVGFQNLVLKN
uniref:Aromatic amino acid beta-eliminating lyase/threonine aldolase domain-containing protein n=1 Tax=Acrobeloides nanus TaxID=290746 RepID=A0A914BUC9_9BILA